MIFHGCCPTSYRKLGGGEQQKFINLKFLGLKVQNQGVSRVMVFQRPLWRSVFRIFRLLVAASALGLVGGRARLCPQRAHLHCVASVCPNLPLLTEGHQSLDVGPTLIPHDLFSTWFHEEPGGLQSMGSQRVRHDWATNAFTSAWPHLNLVTLAKTQFPEKVTVTGSRWTWIWRNTIQLSTDVELFHLNPGVEKSEKRLSVALL